MLDGDATDDEDIVISSLADPYRASQQASQPASAAVPAAATAAPIYVPAAAVAAAPVDVKAGSKRSISTVIVVGDDDVAGADEGHIDEGDGVACLGEKSWAQRDDELRAAAVTLDDDSDDHDAPSLAASGAVKAEATIKHESLSSVPPAEVKVQSKSASSSAPPAPPAAAALNTEQARAVALALAGENVFLTGGAGTGKSFTLRRMIAALETQHGADAVYVTASTGIAGTVIGGTTLHSFAGIGVGGGSLDETLSKVVGNKHTLARWAACKVLVIDEVSMLDGGLFDKLDQV